MSLWNELNLVGKIILVTLSVVSLALVSTATAYSLSHFLPHSVTVWEDQGANVADEGLLPKKIARIKTPEIVKAIYMTACVGSNKKIREQILTNIDDTPINSIILDIKDYTGTLAYTGTKVKGPTGRGCRMDDLPEFLATLKERGIYTIARITVFQDPLYARYDQSVAVMSASNPGRPWTDKNGLAFIDPNHKEYWEYIVKIALEAHEIGFDELNFDYIRFPSDGNMKDAVFSTPANLSRTDVMKMFFSYLHDEMKLKGIVTSADIFGQTVVNYDDLGIGQIYEDILPYFDYVSPMIYPSHFIKGFMNYDNPAEYPYEVVHGTMLQAVNRAIVASSSVYKIRPWLQAFDLGAVYTPEMIRLQAQAVYDAGLKGWYLWDAANRYSREELINL